MIITKNIDLRVNTRNISYLKDNNFNNIKINDIINISIEYLTQYSKIELLCKCDNCGIEKQVKNCDYNKITNNKTTPYYCKDCNFIKRKKTNLNKYGVDNPSKSDNIKEKIRKNYKNKSIEEKSLIEEKRKKTNINKYGVNYVQQNINIRKKTEKTSQKKYGFKTSLLNDDIKKKIKQTNIKLYGYENPLNNINISTKSKNTRKINIIQKYNNKNINIISINDDYYKIKCDNNKNHIFNIQPSLLYHRLKYKTILCNKCNKINSKNISGLQHQFNNFIKENYSNEIIINDRNLIKPYELDIYLPDLKLAFEFNGVYWHNELNKPNDYHKKKTELCEKQNIQLIHIYEDDWIYKQDIVKSMILNKLGKTPNKIYARKTEVKEITDNKLVREFLNKNHIQGFIGSSIKIGLFYKDELVSLMTFGKTRKPLGQTSNENDWEMLRFCNKLNTNIIGGSSKLFKYFIKNYDFKEITTYADKSHSNGKLYEILGFKFIHKTEPNYYYVIDGIRYHRFGFRKDILIKEGYDKTKSEHEIMLERNIYRIYNSGNLKFKY